MTDQNTAPLDLDGLDGLERLAKAASEGPWIRYGSRRKFGDEDCIMVGPDGFAIAALPTGRRPEEHAGAFKDAGYIAAANPATILALISQAREAERMRGFAKHTNWELSYHYGDEDEDEAWLVHSVNGGRSDREWTVIGRGETPQAAIDHALAPATGGGDA